MRDLPKTKAELKAVNDFIYANFQTMKTRDIAAALGLPNRYIQGRKNKLGIFKKEVNNNENKLKSNQRVIHSGIVTVDKNVTVHKSF